MSDIINIIAIVLSVICWILIIRKIVYSKFLPVKSVKAKVIDKYKPYIVSNYPGVFKNKHCIIVFETENKRLSFNVSEISYNSYRINDKGTLKYKGNKIINFE